MKEETEFDIGNEMNLSGTVKICHNGEMCRTQSFHKLRNLNQTISMWLADIKPAVRRGDSVSVIIDFESYQNGSIHLTPFKSLKQELNDNN